jgi:adenine-specific DNA-methyltransferase
MPDYVALAKERIRLAERGLLQIRPLERAVYDPNSPQPSVPPRTIKIYSHSQQLTLLKDNQMPLF